MESQYRDRLSPETQRLVAEVEASSGIGIEVRIKPAAKRAARGRPDSMACGMDQFGARILLPHADYFPDGAVVHELLHIQRVLCQGVPRILICEESEEWDPHFAGSMTHLDNDLEHLVIVPEELRLFPHRVEHWETVLERTIGDIRDAALTMDDRERYALINFTFICHVMPQSALVGRARGLVDELRIADRAERFAALVIPALATKETAVALAFAELKLPTKTVCFEYLDSRTGTKRETPLATVRS